MSWTENELKLLNFLVRHFTERYNINQLAKCIGLTTMGVQKMLKRLERQAIVTPQRLGNAIFYELNFASDRARKATELALFEDIPLAYARAQAKDLERLRPMTLAAVLFGSVLEQGEKAGDVDVLVILEQKQHRAFKGALENLQRLKPKRIQPMLQTLQDLVKNLKKPDEVILEVMRTGKVLWGHDIIVNAIRKAIES